MAIVEFDHSLFRHSHELRVRSYEVDWQGIVHNTNYLRYFEVARIEYFRDFGLAADIKSINNEMKVVIVRNEIDYFAPARYDEALRIFTRLKRIGKTSFTTESWMERVGDGTVISKSIAVHVWLDPMTNLPMLIGNAMRERARSYEQGNCEIAGEG